MSAAAADATADAAADAASLDAPKSGPAGGELVLVRHAPTTPVPGAAAATWRLAPGAMELTAALGMALVGVRLAAPPGGSAGPVDAVVSSHEPKALATARTLSLVLGVPTTTGTDLEEHHRDDVPFMPDVEFLRTVKRFFARPDVLVFGSETAREAEGRFRKGVIDALASRPGKRLAVVTHGTVMALALAQANGLEPFALWQSLKLPEAIVVRRDLTIVERLSLEV